MNILDLLLLFLTCVVDIYCLYLFCSGFFERKKWILEKKSNLTIVFAVTTIMEFLTNLCGNGDINLIIVPIIFFMFIMVVFNAKWGSVLLSTIIVYMIMFGCECLFALFTKISNEGYKNLTEALLQISTLKFLTYIVFLIIVHVAGKKNKKMESWMFIKYLFVPVSSLGMLCITFYSLRKNEDNAVLVGCAICFMMVLIGNILLFSAFTSYMENMYVTIQQNIVLSKQEADINHYRQIMKNNESYYEFIHNIKHQLKIIGLLANEKNYSDIIKVINELDQNVRLNELIVYSKDSHILNIILSEYRAKSVDKGIDYDVYIEPGITISMVKDSDLSVMLSNLLDNALKAAEECDNNAFIKIRIFMQATGGFCVVRIQNRFAGKIFKNNDSFLSTKNDPGIHGIGIKSVNGIAEKYGGFLECYINKDIFNAILVLSTVNV